MQNSRLPVRSIIFLGAPHGGLTTKALQTLVKSKPTEEMIRKLQPKSPTLTKLNSKFRHVAQGIAILACYELKATNTVKEVMALA